MYLDRHSQLKLEITSNIYSHKVSFRKIQQVLTCGEGQWHDINKLSALSGIDMQDEITAAERHTYRYRYRWIGQHRYGDGTLFHHICWRAAD